MLTLAEGASPEREEEGVETEEIIIKVNRYYSLITDTSITNPCT